MTEPIKWDAYDPSDDDRCVWCRVPGCSIPSVEVEHAPNCPSVTGMWPVHPMNLNPHGMVCAVEDCGYEFVLGDYYAEVPHPTETDLFMAVCVPCSLLHRQEAWAE